MAKVTFEIYSQTIEDINNYRCFISCKARFQKLSCKGAEGLRRKEIKDDESGVLGSVLNGKKLLVQFKEIFCRVEAIFKQCFFLSKAYPADLSEDISITDINRPVFFIGKTDGFP